MIQTVRAPLVFSQLQKLGQAPHIPVGYRISAPKLQRWLQVLAEHGVPPEIAYPHLDTLINSRYQRKVRAMVASYLFEGDGPLSGQHRCIDANLGLSPEQAMSLNLPSRINDAVHLDAMLHEIERRLQYLRQQLDARIERSRTQNSVFMDQVKVAQFRLSPSMSKSVMAAVRARKRSSPSPRLQSTA